MRGKKYEKKCFQQSTIRMNSIKEKGGYDSKERERVSQLPPQTTHEKREAMAEKQLIAEELIVVVHVFCSGVSDQFCALSLFFVRHTTHAHALQQQRRFVRQSSPLQP